MIYINNTLRIRRLDDKNLLLERYCEGINAVGKKGAVRWYSRGYYGDLKSALLGALNKELFDSAENAMTIAEVIGKIDEARKEIVKAAASLTGKEEI